MRPVQQTSAWGSRSLEGSSIPKGLCPPAQGCEERATLGQRCSKIPNPNGVESESLARRSPSVGLNPVGVGNSSMRSSRVARSSQPWALLRNPFGIEFRVASFLGFIRLPSRSKDVFEDQRELVDSRLLYST